MEWFIMGRDMHVLCNPSTDAPKSLQIYDDKQTNVISNNTVVSTYDFTISKQHKDATKVQLGGYIVFVDKYRKTKMYTLMSYDGDDITQTWHAEDIGLDLLNESSEKWTEKEPHPIAWYLENRVIGDSGWTIGINEIPQLSRALSFDGESDTQLTRLGDIANQFDGAEIDFSIEMRGSQVTQQHVNIYKKIGSNVIQDRYVDSVNLISLHSTGTIESLTTALKPFGSEMEVPEGSPEGTEASRVTLYNVKYDDGRYYSPWGHVYLYDRQARQQWSRFNQYNSATAGEFDGYIVGSYSYDTLDENELLKHALTQLKKQNTPQETFEAQLSDINADIGDYVQIAHSEYNPPLYLKARVEQVENSYTQDGADTGVLGDYTHLQSQIDPRVKDLLNDLENKMKFNYTWIRYASDDKGSDMTSFPTADTKYIVIIPNKQSGVPSDDPKDYEGKWQLIAGIDGKDGVAGEKGADGRTSYTHFAYANDVSGTTDFSVDDPTGRAYMGVLSDFIKEDSNNPDDYVWSLVKGEDGKDGIQGLQGKDGKDGIAGEKGADGKTSYTHIAYANDANGGGFSQTPDNHAYIGMYVDFEQKDSTDPTKYAWSLIKGSDGLDGAQGIPGEKGADGKTPYTHIAYADTATGGGLSQLPDGKKYIGMYVDFTENDSSNPNKYAWSLIKGADGKDGTPGEDGVAGKDGVGIKSTQIMYAQSTSGTTAPTTGWTAQVPTLIKGQYLWTQTTWLYTDSTGEAGYTVSYNAKDGNSGANGVAGKDGVGIKSTTITYQASTSGTTVPTGAWVSNPPSVPGGNYLWTRTVWSYTDSTSETGYSIAKAGEKGDKGDTGVGIAGKPGADGKTPYFHSAWANSSDGKTGFSTTDSANKSYLGTYTDFTKADSTDPTKYAWSLIKGVDGKDGVAGKAGADGKTPYFHTAWADSKDGKINFSLTDSTNRGYLGNYTDFTQADSTDPAKYRWTELVGNLVIGGRNYILKSGTSTANMNTQTHTNLAEPLGYFSEKTIVISCRVDFDNHVLEGKNRYGIETKVQGADGKTYYPNVWKTAIAGESFHGTIHALYNMPKLSQENESRDLWLYNQSATPNSTVTKPKIELGNKATDYSPAPEDAQEQIDIINNGLADTNSKIAAVPHVSAQAGAPTNPKNGDQWWVLDAEGRATGFKVWNGSAWADSKIQQSMLNVVSLNAVTVTGSTINGSKFTNNFDFTDLSKVHFQGVTEIANGNYKTDFKIPETGQTGHVWIQPDGLHTYLTGANGNTNTAQSISLAFSSLSLKDGNISGSLDAADMERTVREVWDTTDPVNGVQHMGLSKQFRRVWLDGSIFLTGASGNPILKLKNPKLYPKRDVYLTLGGLGDMNVEAQIHINPYGNLWAMSVSNPNKRYICEGAYYMLDF